MNKKVIIVGGVAGGASTAARLRRLDENIEIVLFERSSYISFANCGLPYHIGGVIEDRNALLVQTPEAMKARFNMDIRIDSEVLSIDREKKEITVMDLKNSTKYTESYDELVLSPGSTPIKPRIPNIDSPNIFSLWNIPDMDHIIAYIKENGVKTATVIGGGFIGVEMVENLKDLGMDVTLVEMADQVMTPIDYELAQIVHNHISSHGVHMYLKNGVERFDYDNGVTTISLADGTKVEADMVILSIGISPNSELAKASGLETNQRGGIVVDEHLKTSDSSIYALGDVIEVVDYVSKGKTMIPLAGPANKQGRIVANNICGRDSIYEGSQGTSVAKVFDLTVASTGYNEKQLNRIGKEYGKDYFVTVVEPKSNAGYYPGAFPMNLKVIFDKEGKVLGAQNVGMEGVEKRIDVVATSMRFDSTIYDLQRLELAYAPPYSSAKDPVNMAGFAAENILTGDQDPVLWREIDGLDKNTHIIVDVREELERDLGTIEGSVHIPVNMIRERAGELDKSKTIVVFCAVGLRGYVALRILKQMGYTVKNLIGGYNIYKYYQKDYTNPSCVREDKTHFLGDDGRPELVDIPVIKPGDLENALTLNACGLQCPGPIMKVSSKIKEMKDGEVLKVSATDPGFPVDVEAWCSKTGNAFIKSEKENKEFVVYIQKGKKQNQLPTASVGNGASMIVFSGDFDKAIASMIIANGAAAMGKEVTMFFTFWGLNILRRDHAVEVEKSLIEKMFGAMMPRGSKKLALSKLHMGGMGTALLKRVMKQKNVNSLEELMQSAMDNGVKFVACTMSMDIMGINKDELIDGVEFGGVAAYLGAADEGANSLFI